MDVITSVESCDKFFIARQMGKDSELYLRVIRTDQDVFFIIGCKGFLRVLPSSCLMGMFCRLGSVQLILPVAVTVCENVALIFPSAEIRGFMPST